MRFPIFILFLLFFGVSVRWHYKNPTPRVGPEQSGRHHHLFEN
jgi:hypothetical protein